MSQVITLFTKPNCKLCEDAKAMLETYQLMYNFEIVEQNIEDKDEWLEKYFLTIPVVKTKSYELDAHYLNMDTLDQFLQKHLE
ncbi:glutaredoxin family protein [Filobacillus milosensis]|uniref:Glutaredoxin family protein n=1 Tax=Filobacillus milosensis TaxID=94137 RepID=A0A4Y8IU11_9BACI|nr:glutaredoxin family protein [Filobacillus milosensis]TFB24320.1 glutaredoxin family protein [Filobacillus milosensis]